MSNHPALARRLGTFDASLIGLGSMIGAGVFAAFTPAAAAAGSGLLIGLVVAAFVAFCNATSSAQLAAAYPTSGGTYVYGRERLGSWWGFLAGWGFVIGKTASAAAMAMTFAAYAAPQGWERPVAIAAVVLLTAVNYHGVTRTAGLTRVLVIAVLLALAIALTAVWGGSGPDFGNVLGEGLLAEGWYGVLQSAGLLFFAFAGYARIATMGEEVREPRRTIPRAIAIALGITIVLYAVIAITLLGILGPEGVAGTPTPLADAVGAGPMAWAAPVVRIGAAMASLGALLALIAGLGRTSLAMAREHDLPQWLSAVHRRYKVPHRAELTIGAVICVVIAVADLRGAIGFSSFGVLLYYLVANVAAYTQPSEDRRYPKFLQVAGAVACVGLVVTLPPLSVGLGVLMFAVGILYRFLRLRRSRLNH
ncbi:APA family basic amino acid/polyamine antiporter [Paenarthrobacter nicotinovorans]|uniref:APC family permease n=1 Tax=Paenarthrobacter nicotinovorans TaxID=29320 RepID=UPI00277E4EF3|nr:APC family permease [Paenarthrobacter nicotinovorans]MDP9934742.1 APA family basic amino acid/polyamine antiporter [Paenarthrobacter nicotinovorans]